MSAPIPGTGNLIDVYRPVDDDGYDFQATPDAPFQITCQVLKNGAGAGSFSIALDDSAHGDIAINDVAAIRRDGTTVAALLIETIFEHTLDGAEGAALLVVYSGRLVGAFLEWAVIAPALGAGAMPVEEDAVFDWRSPRYDPADDAWAAATEIMSVADAQGGAWPHQPMGAKFDLSTGAQMILSAAGDDDYAPLGWYLFYRDVAIDAVGRHGEEMLMDDKGFAFVDGIQQYVVRPEDGFITASFKRLEMSQETHRFCWSIYNFEDPDNPGQGLGPAALAYNLYKADLQDNPLDGGQYRVSDSSTKVLAIGTGPAPGMTVGDILGQLVAEAQARGVFPWLIPSFTKANDSNGDPWDRELGITTKTGSTLLQFLGELVASRRISQWRVRNDGVTFDLFRPDYSISSGVELTPAPTTDPRTGELVLLDRTIT